MRLQELKERLGDNCYINIGISNKRLFLSFTVGKKEMDVYTQLYSTEDVTVSEAIENFLLNCEAKGLL